MSRPSPSGFVLVLGGSAGADAGEPATGASRPIPRTGAERSRFGLARLRPHFFQRTSFQITYAHIACTMGLDGFQIRDWTVLALPLLRPKKFPARIDMFSTVAA